MPTVLTAPIVFAFSPADSERCPTSRRRSHLELGQPGHGHDVILASDADLAPAPRLERALEDLVLLIREVVTDALRPGSASRSERNVTVRHGSRGHRRIGVVDRRRFPAAIRDEAADSQGRAARPAVLGRLAGAPSGVTASAGIEP